MSDRLQIDDRPAHSATVNGATVSEATGAPQAAASAAGPKGSGASWAHALSKLRATRTRLADLGNRSCVRVQRALGRASTLLPPTPLGALCGVFDSLPLTTENVLLGYAQGIYAMDFDGRVRWHCPPERFIIYLNQLRISANMRRELKRASYTVTFDRAPDQVLDECAAERGKGEGTWLSERLKKIYLELFELGAMHTVEAWKDGTLVGGSFGVSIGRVWTSESMFHRAPHAGKVQFAAVATHLIERGFEIVDGQQYSDHFARFGAKDVPIAEYRAALARGLTRPAEFHPGGVRPLQSASVSDEPPTVPEPPLAGKAARKAPRAGAGAKDGAARV